MENTDKLKIFAETIEYEAVEQIYALAKHPAFQDSVIRVMPDVHAGAGCTIGTTMTINGRVVPNVVGVDICCGMIAAKIYEKNVDLAKLDNVIHRYIPSGMNIRETPEFPFNLKALRCYNFINEERALKSIGTLGGGNHFIELDEGEDGYWLVVHTGSRHLGLEVANYYQQEAYKRLSKPSEEERLATIGKLKAEGRQSEIADALKKLKAKSFHGSKDMAYCEGDLYFDYIEDMRVMRQFADCNRKTIIQTIGRHMGFTYTEVFTTLHNYIDLDRMIVRKGAVSAENGEKIIIPMNMRDGSLICIGKGNPDWNWSAPHGAGRIMSRSKAKETIDLQEFKDSMSGVYTTCVSKNTIDESPMVYKSIDEIVRLIEPTCDVVDIIRPVYNFKAGE